MLAELEEKDIVIAARREAAGLDKLEHERETLKGQIDELVIQNDLTYESDNLRIVRVQGFRRTWNVDKLESIMPRPLFRRVIKIAVDGDKLDQVVKEGKIAAKKIEPAYEETPNAAYAKWTPKTDKSDGNDEAASLKAKLA